MENLVWSVCAYNAPGREGPLGLVSVRNMAGQTQGQKQEDRVRAYRG